MVRRLQTPSAESLVARCCDLPVLRAASSGKRLGLRSAYSSRALERTSKPDCWSYRLEDFLRWAEAESSTRHKRYAEAQTLLGRVWNGYRFRSSKRSASARNVS